MSKSKGILDNLKLGVNTDIDIDKSNHVTTTGPTEGKATATGIDAHNAKVVVVTKSNISATATNSVGSEVSTQAEKKKGTKMANE